MALHPSLPFAESLPHPVLPSSRVVGDLSEKVDFKKVQQSTSNYKPNKRTTRVKKKKGPQAASLGPAPGELSWSRNLAEHETRKQQTGPEPPGLYIKPCHESFNKYFVRCCWRCGDIYCNVSPQKAYKLLELVTKSLSLELDRLGSKVFCHLIRGWP